MAFCRFLLQNCIIRSLIIALNDYLHLDFNLQMLRILSLWYCTHNLHSHLLFLKKKSHTIVTVLKTLLHNLLKYTKIQNINKKRTNKVVLLPIAEYWSMGWFWASLGLGRRIVVLRYSIQVFVYAVQTGGVCAIYIEPPVADSRKLVENGTVGAKEAELLPIRQAPVPDLKTENGTVSWKFK